MEDTRRKPSDKIFNDIVQASTSVWSWSDYHEDYRKEKMDKIRSTQNYADNWSSIVGMFDSRNQQLMYANLKYQESVDFLESMKSWYSIATPRKKE